MDNFSDFSTLQRDEVRDLNDLAGCLAAEPGTLTAPKPRGLQQTYIAQSNCLTPWDTQQARIHTPDGKSPTLTGAGGGGGRRPGGIVLTEVLPDIAGTLCASGAGLNRPGGMCSECDLYVAGRAYCLQSNMIGRADKNGPQGSGIKEEVSFTLGAAAHHAVAAFPINMQIATRCRALGEGTGMGIRNDGEPAFTLQEAHSHAVAAVDCRNYKELDDVSGTLQSKNNPGYSLNYQNPVRAGYVIRRLTPTEAERLMSLPDNWTKYGYDGKLMSDSARYQFCGNSIVVNVLAPIMQNIADALRKDGENYGL